MVRTTPLSPSGYSARLITYRIPPRSNIIPAIVISGIWLFLILFVVLEAVFHPNFYTPTP